jgi:hypothetical protein
MHPLNISPHPLVALEQLDEVCPTVMVSVSGMQTPGEGMLTAPSFVGISGSTLTQSSAIAQFSKAKGPTVTPNPSIKTLSWGPGRPPVPARLIEQILAYKFVEMSDLIPENLAPTTEVPPSFSIEDHSIVPTQRQLHHTKRMR